MKVLVLGGGDSPEKEVSLRSAKAVADAAREVGYEVLEYDPANGYEYLDSLPKDTIVLPILHGIGGEDGSLQKELEKRGLPFLGSGSKVSAHCFDKWHSLLAIQAAGMPIAKSDLITRNQFDNHPLSKKPYVLKVVHNGSSIGVLIARDPSKIKPEEIDEIFDMESPAILEELVQGTEITASVLDGKALPIIEIVPPSGEEFDYDNKYNGATAEICPPKTVSEDIQKTAKDLAVKIYKLLDCRHLSRTDMMVRPNGDLAIFDTNTMPGLNDQSLFPKSAAAVGLPMPKLVQKFVEMVTRDYKL